MKQRFYKIFYSSGVNRIVRNTLKLVQPLLPQKMFIPPSGTIQIKLHSGQTLKVITNQTNWVTKRIFWFGYDKFEYTKIFEKLITKVGVFYDVGANIGYYSLIAAAENKSIKVVGFEPAIGPLHYFRKNVEVNGFSNVKVVSEAMSNEKGEIAFYEIANKKYSYLKYNLSGESNAGEEKEGRFMTENTVKTSTLDEFVKTEGETQIDLIKIDTEGTEHLILEGAEKVIETLQPIVICEVLFNKIEEKLEAFFAKHGYLFYAHVNNGLKKIDHVIRQEDNQIRDIFFVPPSKESLVQDFIV